MSYGQSAAVRDALSTFEVTATPVSSYYSAAAATTATAAPGSKGISSSRYSGATHSSSSSNTSSKQMHNLFLDNSGLSSIVGGLSAGIPLSLSNDILRAQIDAEERKNSVAALRRDKELHDERRLAVEIAKEIEGDKFVAQEKAMQHELELDELKLERARVAEAQRLAAIQEEERQRVINHHKELARIKEEAEVKMQALMAERAEKTAHIQQEAAERESMLLMAQRQQQQKQHSRGASLSAMNNNNNTGDDSGVATMMMMQPNLLLTPQWVTEQLSLAQSAASRQLREMEERVTVLLKRVGMETVAKLEELDVRQSGDAGSIRSELERERVITLSSIKAAVDRTEQAVEHVKSDLSSIGSTGFRQASPAGSAGDHLDGGASVVTSPSMTASIQKLRQAFAEESERIRAELDASQAEIARVTRLEENARRSLHTETRRRVEAEEQLAEALASHHHIRASSPSTPLAPHGDHLLHVSQAEHARVRDELRTAKLDLDDAAAAKAKAERKAEEQVERADRLQTERNALQAQLSELAERVRKAAAEAEGKERGLLREKQTLQDELERAKRHEREAVDVAKRAADTERDAEKRRHAEEAEDQRRRFELERSTLLDRASQGERHRTQAEAAARELEELRLRDNEKFKRLTDDAASERRRLEERLEKAHDEQLRDLRDKLARGALAMDEATKRIATLQGEMAAQQTSADERSKNDRAAALQQQQTLQAALEEKDVALRAMSGHMDSAREGLVKRLQLLQESGLRTAQERDAANAARAIAEEQAQRVSTQYGELKRAHEALVAETAELRAKLLTAQQQQVASAPADNNAAAPAVTHVTPTPTSDFGQQQQQQVQSLQVSPVSPMQMQPQQLQSVAGEQVAVFATAHAPVVEQQQQQQMQQPQSLEQSQQFSQQLPPMQAQQQQQQQQQPMSAEEAVRVATSARFATTTTTTQPEQQQQQQQQPVQQLQQQVQQLQPMTAEEAVRAATIARFAQQQQQQQQQPVQQPSTPAADTATQQQVQQQPQMQQHGVVVPSLTHHLGGGLPPLVPQQLGTPTAGAVVAVGGVGASVSSAGASPYYTQQQQQVQLQQQQQQQPLTPQVLTTSPGYPVMQQQQPAPGYIPPNATEADYQRAGIPQEMINQIMAAKNAITLANQQQQQAQQAQPQQQQLQATQTPTGGPAASTSFSYDQQQQQMQQQQQAQMQQQQQQMQQLGATTPQHQVQFQQHMFGSPPAPAMMPQQQQPQQQQFAPAAPVAVAPTTPGVPVAALPQQQQQLPPVPAPAPSTPAPAPATPAPAAAAAAAPAPATPAVFGAFSTHLTSSASNLLSPFVMSQLGMNATSSSSSPALVGVAAAASSAVPASPSLAPPTPSAAAAAAATVTTPGEKKDKHHKSSKRDKSDKPEKAEKSEKRNKSEK